jgi:hypothetical protein
LAAEISFVSQDRHFLHNRAGKNCNNKTSKRSSNKLWNLVLFLFEEAAAAIAAASRNSEIKN